MKYQCSCVINVPRKKVVKLFEREDLYERWQDGFQSIVLKSGVKNEKDAVSEIFIQQGKMKIQLRETVLENNLPEQKVAEYVHKHMINTQISGFEELNETQTKYTSSVEYTQFNGLLPHLIRLLFPSKFKSQSEKWMGQFKRMAEKYREE